MSLTIEPFGTMPDGRPVDRYILASGNGLVAKVTAYGAMLTEVETPDRDGKRAVVTLYLDTLDDYLTGHPFFGPVCGRYANRIARGKFTLDGAEYTLATNNGPSHLHGGEIGFDKFLWEAEPTTDDGPPGVTFTLVSPDGDEGYPGTLTAAVTYRVSAGNELRIEYTATTDKPTHLNLTNHAYWNLASAGSGDVLGHRLTLNADRYLPVDDTLIPLGELRAVEGTPMDFIQPKAIGSRIDQVEGGYDHCYVVNGSGGEELALASRVADPSSGRVMEVHTTQPGVQFYTANFLGPDTKVAGVPCGPHHAFCLETQHFPDSPNQPDFPSTVLRPGETFRELTVHKFMVEE